MNNDSLISGFKFRRERRRKKRLIKLLSVVLMGVAGIFLVFNQFVKQEESNLNGVFTSKAEGDSLKVVIDKVLEGARGIYAVAIKNLKTGESYYLNEHKVFETGSLYKLWVMATAFRQIQEGKLSEDEILREETATLNDDFGIASDSTEMIEGTVTLSVREALNQMIIISHNYAALLLTKKIKLSSVVAFLKEYGFTESSVGINGDAPKSTPFDIALFYEKLYKGELASQEYTDEMIGLLGNQQLNQGLPKYLPDKSKVANKTGDIGWFKHDAGIVYTPSGDYVIVVLSESNSPPGAQERIALVSKAVYDYFNGRQ